MRKPLQSMLGKLQLPRPPAANARCCCSRTSRTRTRCHRFVCCWRTTQRRALQLHRTARQAVQMHMLVQPRTSRPQQQDRVVPPAWQQTRERMSCSPTCSRGLAIQCQRQKHRQMRLICRADLAVLTYPSGEPYLSMPQYVVLQQVAERRVENRMCPHLLVLVRQRWGQANIRIQPALPSGQVRESRLRPLNSTAAAAAAQPSNRQHLIVLRPAAQESCRTRIVRKVIAQTL